MSPMSAATLFAVPGFPRVSGDEPISPALMARLDQFSPRERG